MPRLITRAEFARLAGVSKPAITKALAGKLAPALVGERVDADHPAAAGYLAGRGKKLAPSPKDAEQKASAKTDGAPPKPPKRKVWQPAGPTSEPIRRRGAMRTPTAEGPEEPIEAPENVLIELDEYAKLLRPIVDRFGTRTRFREWLDALKVMEEVRAKHLGNEETQERLIDRELVSAHVFGPIKSHTQKQLRDDPKTITRRLYSLARSGATIEQGEAVVREIIGKGVKALKARLERTLQPPNE